ncbi:MAG: hypothetical protein GX554_05940 [Elusimicrobia bacterium]|nr:hypothetical protein [Elusimicrobiota bacterium]
MDLQKLSAQLKRYRQTHIIEHIQGLSGNEKIVFIKNLAAMNFELVFQLYEQSSSNTAQKKSRTCQDIQPPVIISIDRHREKPDKISLIGASSISKGEIAVMIVAGGQGTRLAYPYPKGMYPISPVKEKSLFQIFSEKILSLSLKYNVKIPLLIMTNPDTDKETKEFFKNNGFFGIDERSVFFFCQDILPSLTFDRKLIIKDRTSILGNPDGHGGSLKAVWESGLITKIEDMGIKRVFYCHIDNPLVNVGDPVFLGCHITEGAEFSLKALRKRNPEEKVGHIVMADGKPMIIEYTEFPDDLKYKKDTCDNPLFWAGNIGIHFIETSFIKKLNQEGFVLPYHKQIKKMTGGERDVWKFETFVFDALSFTDKICCVETLREDEFAPLKNKEGNDSPSEVKKAMLGFYRKQLKNAGIKVSPGVNIEISPLCDMSTLTQKIQSKEIVEETYIE